MGLRKHRPRAGADHEAARNADSPARKKPKRKVSFSAKATGLPFYANSHVLVYHGEAQDIVPKIEYWDHVITDPPYSEEVHNKHRVNNGKAGGRKKDVGFAPMTPDLRWLMAHHFQRTRRWCLVFGDLEESAPLWRRDLNTNGLKGMRTCLWFKLGATPQITGDRPAAHCEAIVAHHNTAHRIRPRWNGGGRNNVFFHLPADETVLLTHPILRGKDRPDFATPKPVPLMADLISLFTNPGDVILDCFGGSGSTGIAAHELGRRAIIVEREKSACELIRERLKQKELF